MKGLMRLLLLLLAAAVTPGRAADFAIVQKPDAALPLELHLNDESGRAVRLGDYFGQVPVLLVPGYFECPNLCATVLDGVLESLLLTGLAGARYRLLAVSIAPDEGPPEARRRLAAYRERLPADLAVHFLSGADGPRLAAALGFPQARDGAYKEYRHPAGFVLATPDGRIARYFPGVRFSARDLKLAVAEAAQGRSGSVAERLLLLCAHYDPQAGRYTFAALTALRSGGALGALALGLWVWRRRGGKARGAKGAP